MLILELSSPKCLGSVKGQRAMLESDKLRLHPGLKQLLTEAIHALARLDADRLEELALSCHALNRELTLFEPERRALLAQQAREAAAEMVVFARVLEATHANLSVMTKVRQLHNERLEYAEPPGRGWTRTESGYGHN